VVVRNEAVERPAYVRYGWKDNPDGNLFNGAGLPASPFGWE
jgi:sialate O-acetylesterase